MREQIRSADKSLDSDRIQPSGRMLATVCAGPLLVLFAFTVPLTTLTSTASALGAGPGGQAWILSAMSVGAAAGLLGSGAIGDDYGRRRTFLGGLLIMALASIAGALAQHTLLLVLSRIAQGLGGAAVLACGLGLLGQAFPAGSERTRATAAWAAALGAGVAIGPLLSAALEHVGGWRLPYVLTALAVLALAAIGRRTLPESRAARPRRIDLVGMILLGGGLSILLAGLVEGRLGWARPLTLCLTGAGLVLLAGFALAERRVRQPMLDLALFHRPDFSGAACGALAAGAGVLSLVSFVPTLLERAMHIDTITSACIILAWSATSVLSAYAARWLPDRITPRVRMLAGLLGVAVAQLSLLGLQSDSTLWRLLPGLLLAGAANGVLNAALGYQAVASVPADRTAMGGGANNTARYLGSAIGLSVVAVLVAHGSEAGGIEGLLSGWNLAVAITAGFSLLGAMAVFIARSAAKNTDSPAVCISGGPG